jgi:hypothetical protein
LLEYSTTPPSQFDPSLDSKPYACRKWRYGVDPTGRVTGWLRRALRSAVAPTSPPHRAFEPPGVVW